MLDIFGLRYCYIIPFITRINTAFNLRISLLSLIVLLIIVFGMWQANFPSLESLVAKIYEDRAIAERALDLPQYSKYKDDPYLTSLSPSNN